MDTYETFCRYCEVIVNDTTIATVGHDHILNMHLSTQWVQDKPTIFASAVVVENHEKYLVEWLQSEIKASDEVLFKNTSVQVTTKPIKKYKMGT